ncbi:hypothetical protein [Acinetobacter bouvetii]|uniref:DUF2946 domain-containing protein n=1 Tax=Acinetobacter bouvetii TaxID=202951 RepID=A0A811GB21_9GAMM|nr:hypothetical protein [Acinetobacter bouvetii]CAB1216841.1 hypothetical protein SFB21_2015 [Acinetobacter bouvetii]
MLTALRKQAWFVFLMVFAIGWSNAVLASEQPMHQQMMRAIVMDHQQAAASEMPDCHQDSKESLMGQYHSVEHVTVLQQDQDCHQHMTDHKQHLSCNDCLQLHCQSLSIWLDSQTPDLVQIEAIQAHPVLNFDYTAQHLSGFWQQILRPPKA